MVKKLIYICYLPLSQKIERDFYLRDVIDSKYSAEYWDLSSLFFRDVRFNETYDQEYVRKIDSYELFQERIQKEDNAQTIYIPIITYEYRSLRLYRILTKNQCQLFYFERGCLPSIHTDSSWWVFLGRMNSLFNSKKVIRFLADRYASIMKQYAFVKNYDVVFAAGQIAIDIHRNTSKVVPVHYFDYDEYMRARNGSRPIAGHYCVFLDDDIIHNADYVIQGIKTINADNYYRLMQSFFKYLEGHYKIKVVIAAHPKSNYAKNPFGEWEIYKNETCQLVEKCEFAVMHYSSSISYPVIFKKPIMFVHTSEMMKMFYFKTINSFAESLDQPIYNIDSRDSAGFRIKAIDSGKYEEYQDNYITSLQAESGYSRDIFLNFVRSYNFCNN